MGNVVMIIMTILAVAPLLLVIISSFTDNNTLIRNGYSYFPEKFSLDAYHYIFVENPQVLKAYLVSFRLTAVGTVLSLSVTTLLAYAISKKELPARGVLTFYVFFTMLFNGGLVPTYINYVNIFHIKDTFWGLLLPGLVTNGFNVLLMKSYFTSSIPDEIVEAAYIDGAKDLTIYFKIILPLVKPAIATTAILSFQAVWTNIETSNLYINDETMKTLPFYLNTLANANNNVAGQGLQAAAVLIQFLPNLLMFIILRKSFMNTMANSGIK